MSSLLETIQSLRKALEPDKYGMEAELDELIVEFNINRNQRTSDIIYAMKEYILAAFLQKDLAEHRRRFLSCGRQNQLQNAMYKIKMRTLVKDEMYNNLVHGSPNDNEKLSKIVDEIEDIFNWAGDDGDLGIYSEHQIKVLADKIELFGNHLRDFEPWDSCFNIELFADSLILTGKYIRDNGHTVGCEKRGRKCMAAGGMLKKAYMNEERYALYHVSLERLKPHVKVVNGDEASSWRTKGFSFKSVGKYRETKDKLRDKYAHHNYKIIAENHIQAWKNITKTSRTRCRYASPNINNWSD